MKSFFLHRRLQQTLVFYVDGELSQNEMVRMRQHLENCVSCRQKLEAIHACRKLLKSERPALSVPTEQLWQRITRKNSDSLRKRFKLEEILPFDARPPLRWAVVVAMAILFAVAVWKNNPIDGHSVSPNGPISYAAAIDYGIFLDDIRQEIPPNNFYKRHAAQVVQLAEAQQAIAFPLAAIESLPDSYRLDSIRVLECNGQKCVQFTCIKADKAINIFQHALGQPWTVGLYPIMRAPICNVECLLVNANDFAAVSWQGKDSEYLAVGEFTPQELGQVVQALQ